MFPRTHMKIALTLVFGWLLTAAAVWGQTPPPANAPLPQGVPGKKAPNEQKITISEAVRPAFVMNPIVNRIKARRGQTIPVEWVITGESESVVNLEVIPVALTQDETGAIGANTKVPPAPELEITTPLKFSVTQGQKYAIQGRVRVPNTLSTFHSFGMLVRDAGQLTKQPNPARTDGARIGIKFITQYLLRADISIEGVKADAASKLKFDGAELIEVDGVPQAKVYVVNPTEGPIEYEVRAQIRRSEEGEQRPTFPLWMPVRTNMDEPEKFVARILPGARVAMVSPLNGPVYPGQYYLEASMMGDNRVVGKTGIPIAVKAGEFPGVGIETVQAAPGILVGPSQIELSLQKGGSRAEVLSVLNESSQSTDIEVIPETLDGKTVDWITVRPAKLTLGPGVMRKMSITLNGTGDQNSHRYARMRIKSTPTGGAAVDSADVIVAALGRAVTHPVLEAGQLALDTEHGVPALTVPVKNLGTRHMALEGKLLLSQEAGGRIYEVRGGFGKWVLPGDTQELRFKVPVNLEGGRYQVQVGIPNGEGADPISLKLEMDLNGQAEK